MSKIIKGTTPTFRYKFNTVDPNDITVAILTIKQGDTILIEKHLSSATIGEKALSWTLTQQETLQTLAGRQVEVMLNWRLNDGTRGASDKEKVLIESNHKEEVI